MALLSITGIAFGLIRGIGNFAGASILAFSAVSYMLMCVSYLLFARRLRAAAWFAPLWIVGHLPAAVLTLVEMRRITRSHAKEVEVQKNIVSS